MVLRHKDFAELLGVTSQRISNAKKDGSIIAGADKSIDLDDPVNRAYLREHFHREFVKTQGAEDDEGGLEADKLREEVRYLQARSLKVELQNAELKRDLVPIDVVRSGWGAWASAVRNNILTVGQRVGRGDTALRDRVEREIKRALEKSIESASKELDRIADLPVEVADDED
jgi:phage terminase Nu1 subunit (DNA packaging protein)